MSDERVAVGPRGYFVAFAALALLTLAEVGVVYVPGIARGLLIAALILLAVAKAALVLLVFMHLRGEARGLRLGVILSCLFPAIFAAVLIAEAAWRGST
ncbi:MAG TPA: cytochrome C oxidase subunit IV family protein [Polyangia bacterium]